jgi:hypothetical protein
MPDGLTNDALDASATANACVLSCVFLVLAIDQMIVPELIDDVKF